MGTAQPAYKGTIMSDVSLRVDPAAGIVVGANDRKALPRLKRNYSVSHEWMLAAQGQETAVELRTCEVWGYESGYVSSDLDFTPDFIPDLIKVSEHLFAFGQWNQWEGRYVTNPEKRSFRLWEAERRDVIGWCNHCGFLLSGRIRP